MSWLQLKFDINPEHAQVYEDAMLTTGAQSITYEDQADQPILEPGLGETPLWQQTRITGLYAADIDTQATSLLLLTLLARKLQIDELPDSRWEILEDKDWQREWMQHYPPIDCGGGLWICPSWLEPPAPEASNLLLDPGLAFGTGTHPTTLLCLQWLAQQNLANSTVIDYGCGSGILAIACLLRGAASATAVDIDPQALSATRDNAARNQLPNSRITTFLASDIEEDFALKPTQPAAPARMVFANILAGPLVELAPVLTALTAAGGNLCLSGLLDTQVNMVTRAYRQNFDFHVEKTKEQWALLVARRRS